MAKSVRESLTKAIEGTGPSTVEKWTGQFAAYDREFVKWEKRVDKILKRYRDEDRPNRQGTAKFNVLWSNIQTLIPATFSKIPQADVSRRFKDNDPIGRVASLLLERSLTYEMEHYPDFRETMKACVFDRFLGGRGTAWARYEPHIRAIPGQPGNGEEVTEDIEPPDEELDYECAPVDYVHWRDFGHTVARTWDEVTGVWRKVYMTRQACIDRFGEEIGKKIPLDSVPEDLKKTQSGGDNSERSRALIYEVWDKQTLKAIWISKSMPEVLDEQEDPLGLEQFWPCPKPLFATMTNESLVPIPDFTLYQDQARELDTLAERVQGLIDMLQVKGVYDDSIGALARIFTEGTNGTLLPVKNWAAFAEKNGLAGAIDIVDLKPIYEALVACYEAANAVLQQIYDLTGLSDIVRGQSNASETATAQRIKGQYASLRLKSMQTDVAQFATGLIQLKSQIICGKFSPETIAKMASVQQLSQSDQELIPQAMALLVGEERLADPEASESKNPMRDFRIEVNADTMVQIDEQEEKENRLEFITAQGEFMDKALPLAQASPQITPLIATLWKFGVQAFKVGKTIEGEFDTVIDKLREQAAQPQQPQPDPEMMKIQAQQQSEQARLQFDQQAEQARIQSEQMKQQFDGQLEQQRAAQEERLKQYEIQSKLQFERWKAEMEDAFNRWKVQAEIEGKVVVAEISAKSAMDTTLANAEATANQEFTNDLNPSEKPKIKKPLDTLMEAGQKTADQHSKMFEDLHKTLNKPKRVVRGPDGKVIGIEPVDTLQ